MFGKIIKGVKDKFNEVSFVYFDPNVSLKEDREKVDVYYKVKYINQKMKIIEKKKYYKLEFDKWRFYCDYERKDPPPKNLYGDYETIREKNCCEQYINDRNEACANERWNLNSQYNVWKHWNTFKREINLENNSHEFENNSKSCVLLVEQIINNQPKNNAENLEDVIDNLPCSLFNRTIYETFYNHIKMQYNSEYRNYLDKGYSHNQIKDLLQEKYTKLKNVLDNKKDELEYYNEQRRIESQKQEEDRRRQDEINRQQAIEKQRQDNIARRKAEEKRRKEQELNDQINNAFDKM